MLSGSNSCCYRQSRLRIHDYTTKVLMLYHRLYHTKSCTNLCTIINQLQHSKQHQQKHHQYRPFRRIQFVPSVLLPLYNTSISERFISSSTGPSYCFNNTTRTTSSGICRTDRSRCTSNTMQYQMSRHYSSNTNDKNNNSKNHNPIRTTTTISRMAYWILSFAAAATTTSVAALSGSSSLPTTSPQNICYTEPSQQRFRFFPSTTTNRTVSPTSSASTENVAVNTTANDNSTVTKVSELSRSSKDDSEAKQWVETSTETDKSSATTTTSTTKSCPFYGCPLTPIDVHYNTNEIKEAFTVVRNNKRTDIVVGNNPNNFNRSTTVKTNTTITPDDASKNKLQLLSSAANEEHATFTLIGYKGGTIEQQINQDRAVIVAPYTIIDHTKSSSVLPDVLTNKELQEFLSSDRMLLGVFDGHAPRGETVSEFVIKELPILLANKLSSMAIHRTEMILSNNNNGTLSEQDIVQLTKNSLTDTFIELDRIVPASPSGGCTASVILQQGRKIYVANVGDSRSFIVAYRPHTNSITIAYISREDKPCIPEERARVEACGGQVYIPTYGTSRVVYHDPITGAPTGLAMSRSIGDWEAGKMGVIPNPIVDVLDIPTLVENTLIIDIDDEQDSDSYQVNPLLHEVNGDLVDDVYLFAVSASDGMLDYMSAIEIARVMAHSLFDEAGVHPITALEHLIFTAAQAWQQAKLGRYRDDISLAVSVLRRPPPKKVEK